MFDFPASPTSGQVVQNPANGAAWQWDGNKWDALTLGMYLPIAGGTLTGPLILSGNATAQLGAVPLQQLNASLATYLPLGGGTMTGGLQLSGNAAAQLQAVPLQQLQTYLPLAGGTLTGQLTGTSITLSGVLSTPSSVNAGPSTIGGITLSGGDLSAPGLIGGTSININNSYTANATDMNVIVPIGCTNVTSSGQILTQAGRIISRSLTGAAPSVACHNVGGNWAAGIAADNAAHLLFCATDGLGNPGGTFGYFDDANNLTIGGTLTQGSDLRSKENIEHADDVGLDVVKRLLPKRFNRLEQDRRELGFIAQDIEDVLPEAVRTDINDRLGIDQMPMLAALVNAIKELSAEFETLRGPHEPDPDRSEQAGDHHAHAGAVEHGPARRHLSPMVTGQSGRRNPKRAAAKADERPAGPPHPPATDPPEQ